MDLKAAVLFTTSLLAIINPVSSAVLFATMAGNYSTRVQQQMANQSATAILIILLVVAWLGNLLLQLLGITVPMLQAAGGLILLRYGLRMVTDEETKLTEHEKEAIEEVPERLWKTLAVVPLAIPGTVGAGSITTVVIQASEYSGWRDMALITAICTVMAIVMWIAFRSAGPIARRLGPIGLNIVTRVMGILVTATAFGLLGRGVAGLLPGLGR
ncbi:MAG TPA: MarC family protein [Vicinamibacterales bacterium]|nr:MarC family protein [Vicinamibacterales bacterium]